MIDHQSIRGFQKATIAEYNLLNRHNLVDLSSGIVADVAHFSSLLTTLEGSDLKKQSLHHFYTIFRDGFIDLETGRTPYSGSVYETSVGILGLVQNQKYLESYYLCFLYFHNQNKELFFTGKRVIGEILWRTLNNTSKALDIEIPFALHMKFLKLTQFDYCSEIRRNKAFQNEGKLKKPEELLHDFKKSLGDSNESFGEMN